MSRKGKLTPHAARIHRMLREGATALAIWEQLKRLDVPVSYEGVRKWIKANPVDGIALKGPGRPQSIESGRLDFLPIEPPIIGLPSTPLFLLPFVAIVSATEEIRMEVTKRAFGGLSLPFDDDRPRSQWIIPAQPLANLSDMEYCLLAYQLSDLPSPPRGGTIEEFETWVGKLMVGAWRLKDSVKRGHDIKGNDLFQ
jgi:hypothetical protein